MGNCLPLASSLRKTLISYLGIGIGLLGNSGSGSGSGSGSLSPVLRRRQMQSFTQMYTLGPELGRGQFGTTYLCIEKASGDRLACKCIEKSKLVSREDMEDVRREINILHHLSGNPNIVSIIGSYEDSSYVYVVMDLCEGGELFDRIAKRGHYSEREAARTIKVIVSVVEACHSHGVMHRDLKPENFLFSCNTDDSPLKAIDFGLSVFFKPGDIFHDVVGSAYYIAPEVLRRSYGPQADVWSAGVILYILLCGMPPFWAETEQGIFSQIRQGMIDFQSNPWPHISKSAKNLIRNMLNPDPAKRFTAHQVLCHPWICEDGVAPDRPLDLAILSRMKQFTAMNKMKKIALRVIAERLLEEEIVGLKQTFKMIDADGSGSITFEELNVGLKKLGSGLMENEIRILMDAVDIDKNGSIDYEEFITATLNLNKLQKEEELMAAFSYFDKDGSGCITMEELRQACIDHKMGDAKISEIIKEIDQNNDGCIDYGEFVAMMRKENGGIGRKDLRSKLNLSSRNLLIFH